MAHIANPLKIHYCVATLEFLLGQLRDVRDDKVAFDDRSVRELELDIRRTVEEIFGEDSPECARHRDITLRPNSSVIGTDRASMQARFQQTLDEATATVEGLLERICDLRGLSRIVPTTGGISNMRAQLDALVRESRSFAAEELSEDLQPYILREKPRKDTQRVFLVHGRDEVARDTVATWLKEIGLYPIILHEQANHGLTLIEKFERYSSVGFAVVLLTPDDEGRLAGQPDLRPRARQNVVLELGYFLARLGRSRVCALTRECVEVPSDFVGVVYVSMDGRWRAELERELRAAGMAINT